MTCLWGDLSGSPRHLRLRHSPSIEVGPAHTLTRLIRLDDVEDDHDDHDDVIEDDDDLPDIGPGSYSDLCRPRLSCTL